MQKNSTNINLFRSLDVLPICVPQPDYPLHKLYERHCEIAGWGMTEYNNTSSYPDSVRAARITVGDIPKNYCDYLYQRDVKEGAQAGLGFGIVVHNHCHHEVQRRQLSLRSVVAINCTDAFPKIITASEPFLEHEHG